jgi:hypothetical protein
MTAPVCTSRCESIGARTHSAGLIAEHGRLASYALGTFGAWQERIASIFPRRQTRLQHHNVSARSTNKLKDRIYREPEISFRCMWKPQYLRVTTNYIVSQWPQPRLICTIRPGFKVIDTYFACWWTTCLDSAVFRGPCRTFSGPQKEACSGELSHSAQSLT